VTALAAFPVTGHAARQSGATQVALGLYDGHVGGAEALAQQVEALRAELERTRLWCVGLEQQVAQLAAVLAVTVPTAARGLTRFPIAAAAADAGAPLDRGRGAAVVRAGVGALASSARSSSPRTRTRRS
jgi:hypothetical protein